MELKTFVTAACLSLATATASYAAPIDFNFSFTDGTNTITGLIEGLDSDGAGQMASQITVNGVLDDYIFTSFISNSFDVAGGVVDADTLDVASDGLVVGATFLTNAIFNLNGAFGSFEVTEAPSPGLLSTASNSITFTQVAAVPLPAAGLLLLSGVVGFAGLKRRKKRAA